MLRAFGDLAENVYAPGYIEFGYFDLFKNNHEKIKNSMVPYFLIYNHEKESIELPGEKIQDLYSLIVEAVMD